MTDEAKTLAAFLLSAMPEPEGVYQNAFATACKSILEEATLNSH